MAEPTTTSGISITALFIALLGPMAGPYTVIVMAALAGSLWPLSTMEIPTRRAGAAFMFRIVTSAVLLTGSLSWYLETKFQVPVVHGMAVVSFLIGAMGNGWSPIFKAMRDGMSAFIRAAGKASGGQE